MREIDPKDLADELRRTPRIVLYPSPGTLFHVIAALHLALRHPQFPPHIKISVEVFIQEVKGHFGPLGQEVMEAGSDPANDQPNPELITDEEFNEMLNGPLHHPLRLVMALRMVLLASGPAGSEALRKHCRERQANDFSE
jgi:hypothetical protein